MGLQLCCLRTTSSSPGGKLETEGGNDAGAGRNNSYVEDRTMPLSGRSAAVSAKSLQKLIDEGDTVTHFTIVLASWSSSIHPVS